MNLNTLLETLTDPNGWALPVLILIVGLFIGWIAGRIAASIAGNIAQRAATKGREVLEALAGALHKTIDELGILLGAYLALEVMAYMGSVRAAGIAHWLHPVIEVLLIISLARIASACTRVVDAALRPILSATDLQVDDVLLQLLRCILKGVIWLLAAAYIVHVFTGQPVTALLAGLGVGSIAIGLAAQDTLKNLFGSLMLVMDKPFKLGDRIQVSGFDGIAEHVGLRSTRLRLLDGHVAIMPNGQLANADIRNVSERPNIRQIMNLGVTYDTSPEKVAEAVDILKNELKDHEGQEGDLTPRVYFNGFEASSLNIFVIYWYHPADWWAFNDFHTNLCRNILTKFNAAGIEFAFPTQTLHVGSLPDTIKAEVKALESK